MSISNQESQGEAAILLLHASLQIILRDGVGLQAVCSGTARVLLSERADELPCDPNHPEEATITYDNDYDNDDVLGFWSGVGFFAIRVLANDWYLLSVEEKVVDLHFIYKHVLAY